MTDRAKASPRLPHLRPPIPIERMQAAVLAAMRRHARIQRGSPPIRDRDAPKRRQT
jgi:hypothetical protein